MDRIVAMRTFITVASEGSFTRAADRLEMSPQLVSKYVSQLESQLGVRLLNRTTRKVHLTEAGSHYAQRAQQVLADMDELDNLMGDLQQSAQGVLRISAPVSFGSRHLSALLSAFQQAHPGVTVDLQLNDRKVDIVEEGFDIALRIGQLKSSSLIAKAIAPIRVVLCASPGYLAKHGVPTHPEQLQQHQYLHYSYMEADPGMPLYAWLRGAHQPGASTLICNNGDVLVNAAINGLGIALQPTFICGEALAAGDLQVVLPDYAPAPLGLYAVYAHRTLMASKVRCFIDFIEGFYGDPPYWDNYFQP
ncbi:MAG: LysR family transcriptional regulator [Pseudomonadaceae bacterium]|nr:MAG: LysR family transcriptional regulator [Pseudomonadaceae bacterium]